jgi:hypothetical protein
MKILLVGCESKPNSNKSMENETVNRFELFRMNVACWAKLGQWKILVDNCLEEHQPNYRRSSFRRFWIGTSPCEKIAVDDDDGGDDGGGAYRVGSCAAYFDACFFCDVCSFLPVLSVYYANFQNLHSNICLDVRALASQACVCFQEQGKQYLKEKFGRKCPHRRSIQSIREFVHVLA